MEIVEIARAMYEAPAPDETEGAVWPPGHPGDAAWWMSRATAVMPLVRRAQAEALRDAVIEFESNVGPEEFHEQSDGRPGVWLHVEEAWDHQGAYMDWLRNRADRIEQEVEHE